MTSNRIFDLIARKEVAVLKPLVTNDDRYFDMSAVNDLGWTVIHAAVQAKSRAILKMLLKRNKRVAETCDINARDNSGHTALDRAVIVGFPQGVSLLIREGASVWHYQRVTRNTPLHIAAALNRTKIVDLLLSTDGAKTHVDAQNEFGYTALYVAVCNEHYECYRSILEAGANPLLIKNNGECLVHIAARVADLRFMREILDIHPTADLLLNDNGESAAICAKLAGRYKLQRLLLERRPELAKHTSNTGVTAALGIFACIVDDDEDDTDLSFPPPSSSSSSSSC